MKAIILPANTTVVPFERLEWLIATAIFPGEDQRSNRLSCAWQLERDLMRDVQNGKLPLRHPLTKKMLPTDAGYVAQIQAVVTVDSLRKYVADAYLLDVTVTAPSAAPDTAPAAQAMASPSPTSGSDPLQKATTTTTRAREPDDGFRGAMTRRGLITAHKHAWTTIERDLAHASTNGLSLAAKSGKRGWNEPAALEWARNRGKLEHSASSPLDSWRPPLAGLPSKKHTMQR